METVEDVRAFAVQLPRSMEVFVRGRVNIRSPDVPPSKPVIVS